MSVKPEPLVPPEVDLRDFDYIPLYGERVFNSDTWALCDADEKVAALRLWWRSWHEEPAGSLPNNDRLLADRAGYGVAVRAFLAVKDNAMRGWIECADGRLYHPVVASIAIDVWQTKRKKKAENAADRERKKNKRLAGTVAQSDHCPPENHEIPPDIRPENALKGKGKGRDSSGAYAPGGKPPEPTPSSVGSDEPTASVVRFDPEKPVYDLGVIVLGKGAGGLVTKLLRHHGGDCGKALEVLERCRKKSDAKAFLVGHLRGAPAASAEDVLAETDREYRRMGI